MKKEFRIKKSKDIETILRKKKSSGNKYYIIYVTKNHETKHFRLAMSVSKKIGNAVVRNRQKRQIKNIINIYKNNLNNYNIFIIARKDSLNLSHEDRLLQLKKLLKTLDVWSEETNK